MTMVLKPKYRFVNSETNSQMGFVYRAFSCDVMLSSNMAASIATAINIHLCKHLFTLLCVTVSPWISPFVVQVHDDRVCAWCAWLPWIIRSYPGQSEQSDGHGGGQHDVSKNALYSFMNSKSLVSCFGWNHQQFDKFAKTYISLSSDHSLLRKFVFWCLGWERCTFKKIDENSFKQSIWWTLI